MRVVNQGGLEAITAIVLTILALASGQPTMYLRQAGRWRVVVFHASPTG